MAYERTCIVDLKKYKYCPHCGGYNSEETWRFIYCCENCMHIDKVLQRYVSGEIDELKAQEELEKLDMSNVDNFHKMTKKMINKIYSVKKKKITEVVSEKEEQKLPVKKYKKNVYKENNIDDLTKSVL